MQDEILRRLIQSMNQPMPQLSTEEINLIRLGIPQMGNQEAPNADYLNYLREKMKTKPAAPSGVMTNKDLEVFNYDSVPSAEELNMLVQFGLLRPMGM
jgi:hypothetical protein